MYFILCLILFLAAVVSFHTGGNFDQFRKLLLASGLFGMCDAINGLSLKQLLYTYKSMYGDKINEKGSTSNEK